MALSDIGVSLGKLVFKSINHFSKIPGETQRKLLMDIIEKNKNTEYGKKIGFDQIHSLEDFQRIVPLTTYDDYADYVDRMIEGEDNLIMASKCHRYCSSSGSVGRPKILPKSGRDLFYMQSVGFVATPACASLWFGQKGIKFPKFAKVYLKYVLPVLIFAVFVLGYLDKFGVL